MQEPEMNKKCHLSYTRQPPYQCTQIKALPVKYTAVPSVLPSAATIYLFSSGKSGRKWDERSRKEELGRNIYS